MSLVKVKSNYQVTIPAGIRKIFDIQENDYLEVKSRQGEIILRPVKVKIEYKKVSQATSPCLVSSPRPFGFRLLSLGSCPPTSRSATRDNLNNTTSVNNLSNFRSEAPKWTLVDTYMTSKYTFSYN